jgi:DNA invertase Pin-like site-specific DNA recombinase
MGETIAYRRVSTTDQKTDRQLPGEQFDRVFEDKASAKDSNRPALREMMDYARQGDTIVVHSIDRLARNLADLESLIATLTSKGVTVEFRKESLTFSGGSDAMQTLMLQMMGAFAQFERSMIRERQREGYEAARANGVKMGRPSALSDNQLKSLKAKRASGATIRSLQDEFNLSRASVYRLTGA